MRTMIVGVGMAVTDKASVGVVVAGAAAKGAFDAGALRVLAEHDVPVVHVVGASSGALNGIAYAAGVRCGDVRGHTERLVAAWESEGLSRQLQGLSATAIARGRGLLDQDRLLELLRERIEPCKATTRFPVQLTVVVAPLAGTPVRINGAEHVSFERALSFSDEDFDTQDGLERMFAAVTASAALPGLFAPALVPGIGPTVDGGAVNNAPIRYLRRQDIRRVALISAQPAYMRPNTDAGFVELAGNLVEILVHERLYRDLKRTAESNRALRALAGLVDDGTLTPGQHAAVLEAIGWQGRRLVDVVSIRPTELLPGNAVSGLVSRALRREYLAAGRAAAEGVVSRLA